MEYFYVRFVSSEGTFFRCLVFGENIETAKMQAKCLLLTSAAEAYSQVFASDYSQVFECFAERVTCPMILS